MKFDIANKNKLFIVEDSAQALGSKFDNKSAGTFGIAGGISFFPAKVLGVCLVMGEEVLIQDKEIFHKVYQPRASHGRDTDGEVKSWGRNSRLDNLNAAILLHKLKNYSVSCRQKKGNRIDISGTSWGFRRVKAASCT